MSVSAYLTKGGERRWRVRYSRPDGSRTDKRGFVRKKDALLWEADHVTVAKARGAYVDPAGARVATVGGLWESWIARKRLVLSPSYLDDVEGAWRKYVEPFWGAASIGNVTRPGVQRWVSDMAEGRVDGQAEERQRGAPRPRRAGRHIGRRGLGRAGGVQSSTQGQPAAQAPAHEAPVSYRAAAPSPWRANADGTNRSSSRSD